MSTVGYIVRDMTGTKQHGNFAEGTPSILDTTYTKDVSLNLSPSDVESYARRGSDLHITLANGEVLVLDSYYNTSATGGKNLFLSEEGNFIEVVLEDRAQGMLFASYEPLDLAGKWSAYDEMVFLDIDRIEPVIAPLVAAPLFGGLGAGAAGAAVVGGAAVIGGSGGGGGGGGGGSDTTPPTVDITAGTLSTGDLVNATVHSNNPVISGTGEAGATVSLEINGTTRTTTVAGDGSWSIAFDSSEILTGEYNTTITIVTTDASGNSTTTTDTLVVDTIAPAIGFDTVEGDDVINAFEASDGVMLTGTGEADASIQVTFQGQTQTTTVASNGTWSVGYAAASISSGTYGSTVSVTSTDAAGNSSTSTHSVQIDTETSVSISATQAGDNIINGVEQSAGVTVTGTAEAGATVVVALGTASHTVTADASGNWSSLFTSAEIPSGTYNATISADATDLAGNTARTSSTVAIDTSTYASIDGGRAGGDNIVNQAESQAGVTLTGNAEPGASVVVTVNGVSRSATVDSSGNWSALFESGAIASGEYGTTVSVTATDAAGNTYTTTAPLAVDTLADPTLKNVTFNDDNVDAIKILGDIDTYTVNTLDGSGTIGSPPATQSIEGSDTRFLFGTAIPDGTHLVVTGSDAAGNSASTLLILENGASNGTTIANSGLSQFDIEALDLGYSTDVTLTLNEADVKALSSNSDTLTIHGGDTDTDTVTLVNGVDTGVDQTIDGDIYSVYTIGSDGVTLMIEDDITVVI
ncbi:Ig-like domain-containing protein [Parasedimentitalea psychrophila]|uniref:Ig-like domain-containing protein n=1 Tax=Parasedimentitalea psychrophila TaxID=2997337 RepID=A0A9Y2L2E8_9RHOB|nr:Ig-like domain-containing protein [Parasedimentitalea psychrophila]WIY27461.1 Ig-like domain-containing protein [Parasedimentitalea psychrophila]